MESFIISIFNNLGNTITSDKYKQQYPKYKNQANNKSSARYKSSPFNTPTIVNGFPNTNTLI